MCPTDSDRNLNSSDSKDKDENPFIKFKRFADAQIGAVLQGIIGLPSVFSKQPKEPNSRWAELHDDLKRRDRILAKQRASKASGSTNSRADSDDEEVEIPVKKFPGWLLPANAQADSKRSSSVDDKDGEQGSIDLFSPVTKSLFAHLIRKPMDDVDWSKYGLLAQALSFEESYLDLQWELRDDQMMGSTLNMIQSMIFNSLNETSSRVGNSQLLSSQSVLPYLLFSPYSPLALSSKPPPSRGNDLFEHLDDDFPYCEAFQDLLLASQGRPMATWTLRPAYLRCRRNSMTPSDSRNREFWKANSGLEWIERLWDHGLLTKEPPPSYALVRPLDESPICMIDAKPGPVIKKTLEATSKPQGDHGTEQDAYDFLERIGGKVSSPLPFRDAMQAMEAFIKDAVSYLAEQENNTAGNRPLSSERASPTTAETDPNQDESSIMRRLDFTGGKSTSTQTEAFPDQVAQANATRSVESDQMEEAKSRSNILPATDRVVSTTTTTQQCTDENGSVHTTVMIQKVYADGRTSITSTSKANFTPRDRHYTEEEWLNLPEDERCPHCDAKYDEEDEPKRKKEKKNKGWFWS